MLKIFVCSVLATVVPTILAASLLGCTQPTCRFAGGYVTNGQAFTVEGNDIFVVSDLHQQLIINCKNWSALDSPAMPRFVRPVQVMSVTLYKCPPPRKTFVEALAAINVVLQIKTEILNLRELPSQPPLTAHHFTGLEHLLSLDIYSKYTLERSAPVIGFLKPLKSLHSLHLRHMKISPAHLDSLPNMLESLIIIDTDLQNVPESVLELPSLKELILDDKNLNLSKTEIDKINPLLEMEWIGKSLGPRPAPLQKCKVLREFSTPLTAVEELPGKWVAACPLLRSLHMYDARKLKELPSNLLEGANTLQYVAFTGSELETLPKDLFNYAPNLRHLDLSRNHFRTLPSGIFPTSLNYLDLSQNQLNENVQEVLAELYNLTELNLKYNSNIGDLCKPFRYSRLYKLKKLTTLNLAGTNITHTCSDWRYTMMKLKTLNLNGTHISKLERVHRYAGRSYITKSSSLYKKH